jgi:hypothetical protein
MSTAEYQKEYRKTHPKDPAAANEYMKQYIANSQSVTCETCGGHYKTYAKYKHIKTQKHLKALDELSKTERAKAIAAEEETQKKALAEAEAKRQEKPIPAPRKKKETPVPAPRKKKETPEPTTPPTPPTPPPRKQPTKAEALRMLEEYGSTDEDEPEKKINLSDYTVKLQSKKINSDEVQAYIDKHFESSANPEKSSSKTPRRNKNSSLWKKVSNELDGRPWKYVGENLGKITARLYDKPSVQADFLQMMKTVILHFSKVPKAAEENMKALIRQLKSDHVSKQK